MSISVRTAFLTPTWKAKDADVRTALDVLRDIVLADEECEVYVGETRDDAAIEAMVIRPRHTMVWNDWTIEVGPKDGWYTYRTVFGPEDPTVEMIAKSLRRILRASEDA